MKCETCEYRIKFENRIFCIKDKPPTEVIIRDGCKDYAEKFWKVHE